MHIAFLSSKHPPYDKRVFDKEALSLRRAGFEVTHIAPGEGKSTTRDGVKIVLFSPPERLVDRIRQMPRLFRLASNVDADCYHCNEVDSWFVGVLLKIVRRKKCIFDVHEHYPSTFAEGRFPLWLRPVVANAVRLVYLILLPFTDRIVLAKCTVAGDFWFSDRKLVLVRNYSPVSALDNYDIGSLDDNRQLGDTRPLRLVHLGLISRLRGWPQILDAMSRAQSSDMSLLIIGEFLDDSRVEFDRRAAELGLDDQVEILDWMPFEQAFRKLSSCDIGLITLQPGVQNHVFAMPHKLFDYMLAGLAVIIPSFAVEVAPIVKATNCGILIDSSDAAAIADCLDNLAAERRECIQMGQRGRAAVIEEFNWESEVERLIDMYRDLAANQ